MAVSAKAAYVRQVINRLMLDEAEVEVRSSQVVDREFWRRLNPAVGVEGSVAANWDAPGLDAEVTSVALSSHAKHGFATMSGVLSVPQVERARNIVENLRTADWPAVFAFVYDDLWTLPQAKAVRLWLSDTLGPNHRLLPRIWAHYVPCGEGQGGWSPHLDGRRASPQTVSLWIPLSKATVSNGCMYLVKRSPMTDPVMREFHETSTFTREAVDLLLRNARALPASQGDVLSWDQLMLHWGSAWDSGDSPRLSVALEFSTPDRWPSADPSLFIDPLCPPPLMTRLALIGRALLKYERFEPQVARFAPLARKLCSDHDSGRGVD